MPLGTQAVLATGKPRWRTRLKPFQELQMIKSAAPANQRSKRPSKRPIQPYWPGSKSDTRTPHTSLQAGAKKRASHNKMFDMGR
jgi:hypothetical protein